MSSLFITRAARLDLKKIAAYSQRTWGGTQRRLYLKGLDATFQFLADDPGAGMACHYITAGLRKHPHEPHIVFYEYQDNAVAIVRVLHRSMDVELHLPKVWRLNSAADRPRSGMAVGCSDLCTPDMGMN